MKIAVYDIHRFERQFLEEANFSGHELRFLETRLSPDTASLAQGCEAAIIFVNDNGSSESLEALSERGIQFIALRSAGFNHVDLQKAQELHIKVANVPAYSPYAVAEHTLALMLALNRRITRAHNRIRDLNFSLEGLVGFDMHGKTIGIVGVGKIGQVLARILSGFGCTLLGTDKYPDDAFAEQVGISYVPLEELLQRSDIITLHTALTPETRYVIREETISQMKNGVMLINTSRGGLLNTRDVIDALKSRKIGYLGLDVYEEEEGLFFFDHSEGILEDDTIARLLTFQNVLITSHQAFLTDTALHNIATTTFQNIDSWSRGEPAANEISI